MLLPLMPMPGIDASMAGAKASGETAAGSGEGAEAKAASGLIKASMRMVPIASNGLLLLLAAV